MSRFAYLGGDALHTGMYVALIQRLEREGLTVDLVSRIRLSLNPIASGRAWRGRDRLGPNPVAVVRGQMRGAVHTLPVWAPLPGLSAPALARALGGCPSDRRIVLHTRQIVMGRLALALRRRCASVRVIPELEGDNLAEARYKHEAIARPSWLQTLRRRLEERFYLHYEGKLLRESDAVVCVSRKLKDVMVRRYGLDDAAAARIHVFPSVASRERFAFSPERRAHRRRALGLDDRLVVIYSGNLAGRWQVPDKLVRAFGMIRDARPDACFIVLAPEDQWNMIRPHLEAAALPAGSYRFASAPHHEIVDWLCAADIGLLLRDRHPMNEVAAPGKFAEYALCGLPIVMTDGIGDFSDVVRDEPCACVLPGLDDLEASRATIQEFARRDVTQDERAAFAHWGAERFAIELYVPQLAALYRRLAGEDAGEAPAAVRRTRGAGPGGRSPVE
ncbi:MAG: glycosyltransferase [Candidatus Eisenbacteria bacterium]|nr:glycosyltransferase [Candidatus Eisenbacteria bacterium]